MLSLENFDSFVEQHWLFLLFVVSGLPGLALVLRGVVWGADSFAFWAVSCGYSQFGGSLSSSFLLVWFVENVISCNIFVLAVIMWFFYFFALLGLYFFAKKWFGEKAYLIPIYVSCLTPLFFVEALRFENDFFGWTIALICVGLFSISLQRKNVLSLALCVCLVPFSLQFWFPSIFLLLLCVFLLELPVLWKYLFLLLGLIVVLFNQFGYASRSVTQGVGGGVISEEIPLIGLVFILHILHFYKKIPFDLKFYGWFLLALGILKAKYMFLAVPLLIMGLVWKELYEGGLSIPKLGISRVPVLPLCLLFCVGWFFMGLTMYPTQSDLSEMKSAINLAVTEQLPLYNDWGDGWMLVSLGYDTNYKISSPQPDWNNLKRPYIAWAKEKVFGCNKIANKIQVCN